jgi:hypothetical protein
MTRLLKLALCIAAFVAALLVGHQNARAATSVDPARIASDTNGRLFQVMVSQDTGYTGRSFVGGTQDSIWLSLSAYRDAERGGGAGVFVLLHEIGHTTGITNERQADCYALKHLRGTLQQYFGFNARQVQVRYRAALALERTMPAVYRVGVCL